MRQGKSNFARRLEILIETMNKARQSYEEPITVGYLCEFLGYTSENILKQFFETTQEPEIVFMEMLAEKLGVNKLWLSKGAQVPMFDNGNNKSILNMILEDVKEAQNIYFAIGKESYKDYVTIIIKLNDIKYTYYRENFVFHANGGAHGQNQLMELYTFLCNLKKMLFDCGKKWIMNVRIF